MKNFKKFVRSALQVQEMYDSLKKYKITISDFPRGHRITTTIANGSVSVHSTAWDEVEAIAEQKREQEHFHFVNRMAADERVRIYNFSKN